MSKSRQSEALIYSTVGVGVMFAILLAVNVISGRVKARVDMTADHLYTLSDGTRKILSSLDTPVKIRLYATQGENAMPVALQTHVRRVEDLLAEYRQLSRGNLEVEKLDPQPDSDAEESATLDGIEGQPISMTDKIYLGVSISCLDAKATVPFLSPEREKQLEYDITRAISSVVNPQKPVVGVLSSLPIFGMPMNPMMMQMGRQSRQDPWILIGELKRGFNVRQVEPSADRIDEDIKVLVLIHPKNLSEPAQFAIDQFLLRGGRLLVFVDPLCAVDSSAGGGNPLQRAASSGSNIEKLFKAWGYEFGGEKVVADMNFVTQLSRGGRPEAMPTVLSINREGVDGSDIATGQLDNLLMAFAGSFTGSPAQGLKESVLLHSTGESQLIEKMMAEFSGAGVSKDFVASGKEQKLAIRLTGKFKSAFPDGKPKDAAPAADEAGKDKKDPAKDAPALKESSKDGVVVMVGDVDMLYDQFAARVQNVFGQQIIMPLNQNLDLLQNLVEQLSGDMNLVTMRSRSTVSRPFTVVKKMQAQAEKNYREKIKQLEDELSSTQQRLNELQKTKDNGQKFILSAEQQKEVENFRKKQTDVKRELKDLRKQLRRDIDSLENRIKWANIAGMPLMITLLGLAMATLKRSKTSAK